jgi:hypothetical protein
VNNDRHTIRACRDTTLLKQDDTRQPWQQVKPKQNKTKQQAASVHCLPSHVEISWLKLLAPLNMLYMYVTKLTDVRRVTEIKGEMRDK